MWQQGFGGAAPQGVRAVRCEEREAAHCRAFGEEKKESLRPQSGHACRRRQRGSVHEDACVHGRKRAQVYVHTRTSYGCMRRRRTRAVRVTFFARTLRVVQVKQ